MARKIAGGPLIVRNVADADALMDKIRNTAASVRSWMAAQSGDPLEMLRRMKFEPVGFHPIEGHALNIVEQVNQTWTFCVALAAARQLLVLHPDVGGLRLAPGADACQALDIMSVKEGCVGAETFAAVTPQNNGKLAKDLLRARICIDMCFSCRPSLRGTIACLSSRSTESRYGQSISN
jgi:hypothetical protein